MSPLTDESAPRLQKELASKVELLEPLVEEAEAFLLRQTDDEELIYRAVLLLSEAATNAMQHGNGFDPDKKVRIEVIHLGSRVRLRVCDEGVGFVPDAADDPLDDTHLLRTSGRGLFLMREMADEVTFDDDGRCVIIDLVA